MINMLKIKKIVCVILFFLFFTTSLPSNNAFSNELINKNTQVYDFAEDNSYNQCGRGYRYNIQGWVYTYIEGDPYERGYQYGCLIHEEIIDMLTRWSNMIHNHPILKPFNGRFSQDEYNSISDIWWNYCMNQCRKIYWDKFPVEYKEEIRGIVDGVNDMNIKFRGREITYEDILASNVMYLFLSKLTYGGLLRGLHPLLDLFYKIKNATGEVATFDVDSFITSFLTPPEHHHCSSFIATGDATKEGQMIISNSMWSSGTGAGMWWWTYYIAIRWNIILDINPTSGHRVIMPCAPGYIWSDHDFYQNDAGIVFIETTLPQGLWSKKGLPLTIRARSAVQYSNSIDDVIYYLKTQNDGVMNAVWLIGDAKTGEIARYELGLHHDATNRTHNGFHWSSNNAMDLGVRLEKLNLRKLLQYGLSYLVSDVHGYEYYFPRYRPAERDIAFMELGNKYYGEIDIDIFKEIMSTNPIGRHSPDCKITSTNLLENNGLWVFTGNPGGRVLNIENLDNSMIKFEESKPVGWVRIFGLDKNSDFEDIKKNHVVADEPEIVWMHNTEKTRNDFSSSSIMIDGILYSTTSLGEVYAIDSKTGEPLWNVTIGENPTYPVLSNDYLYIGTADGLKKLDLGWMTVGEKKIGKIISRPVIANDKLFVGNEKGDLYCYDALLGDEKWHIYLNDEIYISNAWDNKIFVSSGKVIYSVNVESGNIEWSFETDGMITSRAFAHEGNVYFGSWDTYFYILDALSGDLNWRFETGWGIDSTAVVSDSKIFFGSNDNNFYALDIKNGSMLWFFTCNSGIHSSPVVNDNFVFFGSDDGRFYMLNKSNGYLVWNFSPDLTIGDKITYYTTPILSDPAIEETAVYIGSGGIFYALSI